MKEIKIMDAYAEITSATATMGGHPDDSPLWQTFEPARGFCSDFPCPCLVSMIVAGSGGVALEVGMYPPIFVHPVAIVPKPPYSRFVRLGGRWRLTIFTEAQETFLAAAAEHSFILDGWTNPDSWAPATNLAEAGYLEVKEIGSDHAQYTGRQYKITTKGLIAHMLREKML